jgi:hypothetical protein
MKQRAWSTGVITMTRKSRRIRRNPCRSASLSAADHESCLTYKVVQIWPGLIVCKQVTVCPGHIWTTLYIQMASLFTVEGNPTIDRGAISRMWRKCKLLSAGENWTDGLCRCWIRWQPKPLLRQGKGRSVGWRSKRNGSVIWEKGGKRIEDERIYKRKAWVKELNKGMVERKRGGLG